MMGVAHVEDTHQSGPVELEIVQSAMRLIQGFRRIRDIDRLMMIAFMLC